MHWAGRMVIKAFAGKTESESTGVSYCHSAYNVIELVIDVEKTNGVVSNESEYHPPKAESCLVGSGVGAVAVAPKLTYLDLLRCRHLS